MRMISAKSPLMGARVPFHSSCLDRSHGERGLSVMSPCVYGRGYAGGFAKTTPVPNFITALAGTTRATGAVWSLIDSLGLKREIRATKVVPAAAGSPVNGGTGRVRVRAAFGSWLLTIRSWTRKSALRSHEDARRCSSAPAFSIALDLINSDRSPCRMP